MAHAHTIRLRDPWMVAFREPGDPSSVGQGDDPGSVLATCERARLDDVWDMELDLDFRKYVVLSRNFHSPTQLDSDERVDLVVNDVKTEIGVWINGTMLGVADAGSQEFRSDVSRCLRDYNQLQIEFAFKANVDIAKTDAPLASSAAKIGRQFTQVKLEIL